MVTNTSKNSLKDCEIVNLWANSIEIMRTLKREDDLYLDELFLLSTIYLLVERLGRPANQNEVFRAFNILSYRREKMITNIMNKGLIRKDIESGNAFKYSVTNSGDQLLIKYKKAMEKLCEG